MIKDFSKIETFLTVVKEKSFSKASKKLGISQPAVTQQIKLLEEYVDCKIVERKKNGIRLTKAGEELYKIAQKLEKCLSNAEKEIIRIMNKELTFIIGASFTIGNYILPGCLSEIKNAIKNDVMIKVELTEAILGLLTDKKIDLALIESPIFLEGVIYREWLEDELVLFSNRPLPKYLRAEDLYNFNWICREEESHTRKVISEVFEEAGIECKSFNIISTVSSSTAAKMGILKSPKEGPQTVSIMSKFVIEDEVEQGILYTSKIKGIRLTRSFYVAYLKERKNDAFVDNVVSYILAKRRL